MFNHRILKSISRTLNPRLFLVVVIGALLVPSSSPTALARSFTNGFNLRMKNAMPSTGELADNVIYLPLVMNNFPLIPDAPVLNAISNEDGDGTYTVSWSSSVGANSYTLQEDVSADFSNPTTVYAGFDTSTAISGRDVGMYYYRAKASNAYASSGFSSVESVEVTAALPDCPQTGQWYGSTSQGYPISFVVENSPRCQMEY